MDWAGDLLVLCRVLVAPVFAVAAIGKLADRRESRRSILDYGLPGSFARPLALVIPIVEMLVALMLLVDATVWIGAVGSLALLSVFSGLMLADLFRGRKHDCHCLGKIRSSEVSWKTVARNCVFMCLSLAILYLWQGSGRLRDWPNTEGSFWLLISLAFISSLGVAGWILDRRIRLPPKAIESQHGRKATILRADSVAPDFTLQDTDGTMRTLDSLLGHRLPLLLIFSNPDCGACAELMPQVALWQRDLAKKLNVSVVSAASIEVNRQKAAIWGLSNVLSDQRGTVSNAYDVRATPSAVVISSDKIIDGLIAEGGERISLLVARFLPAPPLLERRKERRRFLAMLSATVLILITGTIRPLLAQPSVPKLNSGPIGPGFVPRIPPACADPNTSNNNFCGNCFDFFVQRAKKGVILPQNNPCVTPGDVRKLAADKAAGTPDYGYTLGCPDPKLAYGVPYYKGKAVYACHDPRCSTCGKVYDSKGECVVKGPGGPPAIVCGFYSMLCKSAVCVKCHLADLTINTQTIALQWNPIDPSTSQACKDEANKYNAAVWSHEAGHVLNSIDVEKDTLLDFEGQEFEGCGADVAAAKANCAAQLIPEVREDAQKWWEAYGWGWHLAVGETTDLPDCNKC